MRIRIRARRLRDFAVCAPGWRWQVTLVTDPVLLDDDDEHIIHVGEFPTWEEALRQGYLAWRFANMRFRVVGGAGATSTIEVVSL